MGLLPDRRGGTGCAHALDMRIPALTFTLMAAGAVALAANQQPRGAVRNLTVTPGPIVGNFRFAVDGTNPCSAVHMDFGDGSSYTYPVRGLPDTDTIWHHYTRDGNFVIRATGSGNCDGDASTRVSVTLPPDTRPARPAPTPETPARPPSRSAIRFAPMDQNGDGVVTRAEWRGSQPSFDVHDWNRDGLLSGDEVRFGAPFPPPASTTPNRNNRGATGRAPLGVNWSEAGFRAIDGNRDNRLSWDEWPYDDEDFVRVDRNHDNQLSLGEFVPGDIDDDRGDRFANLDLNGDNRVDRSEWHGSVEAFRWLDQNNDGQVTQAEAFGTAGGGGGQGRGQTGRGNQGGSQGQGRGQGGGQGQGQAVGRTVNSASIAVSSRQQWTDTGMDIEAGELLTVRASGSIRYASNSRDAANPNGASGRAATARAPLPNVDIGALIGRIGNGTPFFVGAQLDSFRMPRAGRLYLGTNDDVLSDNQGDFRVTVTVSRVPEPR